VADTEAADTEVADTETTTEVADTETTTEVAPTDFDNFGSLAAYARQAETPEQQRIALRAAASIQPTAKNALVALGIGDRIDPEIQARMVERVRRLFPVPSYSDMTARVRAMTAKLRAETDRMEFERLGGLKAEKLIAEADKIVADRQRILADAEKKAAEAETEGARRKAQLRLLDADIELAKARTQAALRRSRAALINASAYSRKARRDNDADARMRMRMAAGVLDDEVSEADRSVRSAESALRSHMADEPPVPEGGMPSQKDKLLNPQIAARREAGIRSARAKRKAWQRAADRLRAGVREAEQNAAKIRKARRDGYQRLGIDVPDTSDTSDTSAGVSENARILRGE